MALSHRASFCDPVAEKKKAAVEKPLDVTMDISFRVELTGGSTTGGAFDRQLATNSL